jgi:ATP-dependent Lhr-like helicase
MAMENGVSLGQSPIAFLSAPASAALALGSLSEGVASWFRHRHGQPTLIQRHAWPEIPRGNHLLLSAPTGTGKTLAAFLPVLDQLLYPPAGDPWAGLAAGISCLYISPLRALCNDVLRSLREVGDSLRPWLPEHASLPRLGLRTGDTSAGQRQHLREDPPAILLTTPESLAILLSLPSMQPALTTVRWVIVDEVHALAGSKRGADLALSLERLQDQSSQEMQRIGLSATATPLPEAARYLVGVGRPCRIARVADQAPLEISVTPLPGGRTFLADLINQLAPVLPHQRSTLIFTNTRGLAERLGWGLRRALVSWDRQIAVHHSALAASRREEVEAAFKRGQLRVVVSSTSLELGIDIGSVDLVVLVHPPGDVIRLLQRVGRSGHAPQDASGAFRPRRGLLLTDSPAELLEAVVTVASGRAGQYEPLQLVVNPLDVLCQQLVGMAMARWWPVAEAYALCRRATPFRDLTREDFEEALAYLLGRDQEGEAWLPARLREDGDGFLIRDEGTARLLRRNLGTILGEDTVAVLLRDDPSGETGDEFPEARAVGNVDQRAALGWGRLASVNGAGRAGVHAALSGSGGPARRACLPGRVAPP